MKRSLCYILTIITVSVASLFAASDYIIKSHAHMFDVFGNELFGNHFRYLEIHNAFETAEAGNHDLFVNPWRYWNRNFGSLRVYATEGVWVQEGYALAHNPLRLTEESFNIADFNGAAFNIYSPLLSIRTFFGRLSSTVASPGSREEAGYPYADYTAGFKLSYDARESSRFITNFRANNYNDDYLFFSLRYIDVREPLITLIEGSLAGEKA